eukprot:m.36459 g.36459  ORF g.36459 m.36459 type:complete len:407 (-) comp10003_c0_seq3:456-1676(-)
MMQSVMANPRTPTYGGSRVSGGPPKARTAPSAQHHQTAARSSTVSPGFGSSSQRFTTQGMHPRSCAPGTVVSAAYDVKEQQRKLGPGSHRIPLDLTAAHAQKGVPKHHHPYKNEWDRTAAHPVRTRIGHSSMQLKCRAGKLSDSTRLGPGAYSYRGIGDDELSKIPVSLSRPGPRFKPENKTQASLPAPGSYSLPTQKKTSPSRYGILDSATKRITFTPIGVDVEPGHYSKAYERPAAPGSLTVRGPYDVTTGPRFKKTKSPTRLAPGQYGIPHDGTLSTHHHAHPQHFRKGPRFERVASDRLSIFTLSQKKSSPDDPGPGHFNPTTRPATGGGFVTHSDRTTMFDTTIKAAQRSGTAPANYNIRPDLTLSKTARDVTCLKSTIGRFTQPGQSVPYMQERLSASYR